MKYLLFIFFLASLAFCQIGSSSNKVKISDSVGNFVHTTTINGNRSLDVKISDTIKIRDSAKVYAHITDSIRGYAKITDTVRISGHINIIDSIVNIKKIDTLLHIKDSIKSYANITDSVKIRGRIDYIDSIRHIRCMDTLNHIKDTIRVYAYINDTVIVKTKTLDTPYVRNEIVYPNDTPVCIFGRCINSPTALNSTPNDSMIDLWYQASNTAALAPSPQTLYTFPASAAAVACSSSSRYDSIGAIGIDSIYISYLDGSYAQKNTTLHLRGLTKCTTSVSDIFRINRVTMSHSGANYCASGNIFIKKLASPLLIYATIPKGYTESQQAFYTVPNGRTFYITSISVSSGAWTTNTGQGASFVLRANYDRNRSALTSSGLHYLYQWGAHITTGAFQRTLEIPLFFPSHTDIKMSVKPNLDGTVLDCFINGKLIQ